MLAKLTDDDTGEIFWALVADGLTCATKADAFPKAPTDSQLATLKSVQPAAPAGKHWQALNCSLPGGSLTGIEIIQEETSTLAKITGTLAPEVKITALADGAYWNDPNWLSATLVSAGLYQKSWNFRFQAGVYKATARPAGDTDPAKQIEVTFTVGSSGQTTPWQADTSSGSPLENL